MRELIIVTGHSRLDSGGVGTHVRVLTSSLEQKGTKYKLILGTGLKSKLYNLINKKLDYVFKARGVCYSTALISSINFFEDLIEKEIVKLGIDKKFLIHCHDRQSLIAAINLKNKYDIKAIQTIHAPFRQQYEDNLDTKSTLIPFYIKSFDTAFLLKCDGFIAVDELQRDIITTDYQELVGDKKTTIIHNAVEGSLIEGISSTKKENFHVVARYLHEKNGVEYAIRAFNNFSNSEYYDNSKLIILGEGGEFDKLKYLTKELKISDKVEFKGAVNREECLKYISRAKSSLVPSVPVGIYIEATSLTMLESLALKTPLIASNIGGMKEVLEGKNAAFLVSPKNVDEIEQAFIQISQDNIDDKVNNGFELIKNGYTSSIWIKKHLDFYSLF